MRELPYPDGPLHSPDDVDRLIQTAHTRTGED
jgi:hypothetical protein